MIRTPRLRWPAKIGYAVGDFGLNLFYTFCTLFLLYYYTDVLGLSATAGGLIIMVALVFEALVDPLMGFVASRTSSRMGRYRPYLLFGAVPLAASFVLMFVPTGLAGNSLIAFAALAHLVFRTIYAVVGIPYAALSAEITLDSGERSQVAGLRMIFALVSATLLSSLTLPASKWLGGGVNGFFWVSLIYAALSVPAILMCFAATREQSSLDRDHPSLRDTLAMLRSNWPLQILLAATVLALVGSTMLTKTMLYYLKYYVGSEAAVTYALVVFTLAAGLSIPFWLWITARSSKRLTWLAGSAVSVANWLAFYALSPREGLVLWVMLGIGGFANGAISLSFWAMLPDTVEFGEWKAGLRSGGAIYGLVSLTQKLSLGLGIGLLGILLDTIGFHANMTQTPETLQGIRVLFNLVPAAVSALVAVLIWFYPLDHRLHGRITRVMQRRLRRANS